MGTLTWISSPAPAENSGTISVKLADAWYGPRHGKMLGEVYKNMKKLTFRILAQEMGWTAT